MILVEILALMEPLSRKSSVEALTEILLTELEKHELEPELSKYKGDFATRALEYCIENSPVEILDKLFGLPALRKLASALGIPSVDKIAQKDRIICELLKMLGFSVPPSLIGIGHCILKLQRTRREFSLVKDSEKIGLMADAYNEVERVLGDVFFFYVRFLWQDEIRTIDDIDGIVRTRLNASKPVYKLGFGDLICLMRNLDATMKRETLLRNRMVDSFGKPTVLAPGHYKILDEVSPYRRFFVHYKGEKPEDEKCDGILTMLTMLAEELKATIYPDLICIVEDVTSGYGTHYIRALDEFGNRWIVFTDKKLDSSMAYFMFSRTVPIAVKPILLEQFPIFEKRRSRRR